MSMRIPFPMGAPGRSIGYTLQALPLNVAGTTFYYDFASSTFKSAGWTTSLAGTGAAYSFVEATAGPGGDYNAFIATTPVGTFPDGDYIVASYDLAASNTFLGSTVIRMFDGSDQALEVDARQSDHSAAGTLGQSIGASGSANDPWIKDFSGVVYTATQAGSVVQVVQAVLSYLMAHVPQVLALDSGGRVAIQPGQVWPVAGTTPGTTADFVVSARANAVGLAVIDPTAKTLTLYGHDRTTVVYTLPLDAYPVTLSRG